jgi:hypothetical protein
MALLKEERRNRWISVVEEIDYTHPSRKSWALLRKLGAAQPSRKVESVAASDIANLLFNQTPKDRKNRSEKRTFRTTKPMRRKDSTRDRLYWRGSPNRPSQKW